MSKIFHFRRVATSVAVALSLVVSVPVNAADSTRGKKIFKKCSLCHSLTSGKTKIGPSLHGLYGRTAGTFVDARGRKFKHSKDFRAAGKSGLVWNSEVFAQYIVKPKRFIGSLIGKKKARTKMVFNGLKKPADVADLVAYLDLFLKGKKEGK